MGQTIRAPANEKIDHKGNSAKMTIASGVFGNL